MSVTAKRSIKRILKIPQAPDELYCHWYADRLTQIGIHNVLEDLESLNPRLGEAVAIHYRGLVSAAGILPRDFEPSSPDRRQAYRLDVTSGMSYLYPEGE